ncbi:hypothetical protein [Halorubrum sp. GN12_10-3_MGM]|uniref:hypothetical protein n=1 Tax=Halorubrum sp. GN12_10-3_MGM TaxID=2518113 RepID=UPI0010F76312|nr:hypothetical protein [Halorubrum sp. GN12_10-3_MGM]TKX64317.1 hypothetical protein EXE47_11360 [Halorubrum sp. GN12_10-3_MGM]
MTDLVVDYSESKTIELIKTALDNTRGISEYYVEGRQIIAKTSVGFPRILWSYGEKLIIDISDSTHGDELVLNVSADKEIWMNIGANPEKYKRRFVTEFEFLREQNGDLPPTDHDGQPRTPSRDSPNSTQSKEVHSDRYLSSGVKKLVIAASFVLVLSFLMLFAVNGAILSNTPDVRPTDGGSGPADSWEPDGSENPYGWSPSSESSDGETESDEQTDSDVSSDTDRENRLPVSCSLATYFNNNTGYNIGIMESEFPPSLCDDVIESNPDVTLPRYDAICDELDVVSPLVYGEDSSLSETQRSEYNQYQDQRIIAVVLTSETVSADFTRCRLQTFESKAKLHIATPMGEWETTKNNLEDWSVSDNVNLWAYNSTHIVSEDDFNSTTA